MPITQPLSVSASDIRFSPTQRMSAIVMRSTAPVCLSPSASTIPTTITTAMLRTVLPNPVSNAAMNAARSMPGMSANSMMGTSIAMNTCQRNFVIRRNSRATTAMRPPRAMSVLSVIFASIRSGGQSRVILMARADDCDDGVDRSTTGCTARRDVPCAICWRHETPVAATIASGDAFTAGKSRIPPICMDRS